MFNEPAIMETIASVSKALQEYERTGGFAPAIAAEAADAALEAPTDMWSRLQMRLRRRQPMKVQKCHSPSSRKLLKLWPPSQRLAR
jgi:hypothetical protein